MNDALKPRGWGSGRGGGHISGGHGDGWDVGNGRGFGSPDGGCYTGGGIGDYGYYEDCSDESPDD